MRRASLTSRRHPLTTRSSRKASSIHKIGSGRWSTTVGARMDGGPSTPARPGSLCPGTRPNPMLIVPPGVEYRGAAIDGLKELTEGEAAIAHLPEWENGSNNWAVSGRRTASGKPLVAGDPHRPLDVPNVYYQ